MSKVLSYLFWLDKILGYFERRGMRAQELLARREASGGSFTLEDGEDVEQQLVKSLGGLQERIDQAQHDPLAGGPDNPRKSLTPRGD